MEVSEADLINKLRSGDEDAYRVLLDRHLHSLNSYVMRMMASSADAEDIVQETFVRLWTHAAKYDPKVAKLSTWLHNIAHNLVIDHFRKHNRLVLEEQPEDFAEDAPATRPIDHLIDENTSKAVSSCLMQLPERQRSAIIMCHYQGMSNKDAAEILDVSVDAVESLMARGRRKLRQLLNVDVAG